jgi:D-amino-acid dehydrogenase
MSDYYQGIEFSQPDILQAWHGFRPCTPDGLPYIGKSRRYSNLTIATGHAMMGMSLGPATGMLVSQIMTDQKPAVNCSLFDVDRYQ